MSMMKRKCAGGPLPETGRLSMSCLALCAIAGLHDHASADTITVCASGCDFSSINAAIGAAEDGDVIQLSAETYLEGAAIVLDGTAITLLGATDPDGGPASILDGGDSHRVLRYLGDGAGTTSLANLVIRNGTSDSSGGGGLSISAGSPVISNCLFTGNQSSGDGGGARSSNASPTFTDCIFEANGPAREAGGLYHSDGIATITRCAFTNNTTEFSGGGLYLVGTGSVVEDCTFTDNTAESGAGMTLFSEATVSGCTFSNNFGNGLYLGYAGPTVRACLFVGNIGADGGGLVTVGANPAVFEDCTFQDNFAFFNGGGAYNTLGSPTFTGCTFTGNEAEFGGGGMATVLGTTTLEGCRFWCNTPNAFSGSYDGSDNCINEDCTECDPPCPGDFDGSGVVDVSDLLAVIAGWDDPYNVNDLLLVISEWNATCP
ncbi:MAG: right-handed parallel beta-helix repeat-containing protein [Planctomycetota bacterium]|nr:right-handed parallel beta-helix repeat-containing protein [Planctomycetota bacterium]